jgi:hypothetical protein
MTQLGELDLNEAAIEAAGNWQDFDCFVWFRKDELDEPSAWAVIYHSHRDSGLLDQSNAAVIDKALEPFTEGSDPDVVSESHSHWAVGHVDGFSIRVFRNAEITPAFICYHELMASKADYPVLDEEDYSRRESEATFENIDLAAWRLQQSFDLPEDWQSSVFDWLWQNNDSALENVDDQGAWPEEDDLEAAFINLGYERAA